MVETMNSMACVPISHGVGVAQGKIRITGV
jgi:hypothetical protein